MNIIAASLLLLAPQEVLIELDSNCMDCHKPEAADWKASVHGEQRVGCIGCHGSDKVDAKRPEGEKKHAYIASFLRGKKRYEEKGDEEIAIPESIPMCNKCHQGVGEAFKKSEAHYDEVMDPDSTKWKGCQNCHPHHTMVRADFSVIVDRKPSGCARCHKPTSKNYKKGKAFADALTAFRNELDRLEARLESPVPGISQYQEQLKLADAKKIMTWLRTQQHTQLFEKIGEKIDAPSKTSAAAYNDLVERDETVGSRAGWLVAFLVILGINTLAARAWLKKGRAAS